MGVRGYIFYNDRSGDLAYRQQRCQSANNRPGCTGRFYGVIVVFEAG